MRKFNRTAALGVVGVVLIAVHVVLIAVHVVLAILGAASVTEWLGGAGAGMLFLLAFAALHSLAGACVLHGMRTGRRRSRDRSTQRR